VALSDKKILEEMEAGNVIIDPFVRKNLNTSSYDVTLGDHYYTEHPIDSRIFNIWNEDNVHRVWGEPKRALPAKRVLEAHPDFKYKGFDIGDQIILIGPGETILAHTSEFIGGKNHITTMMKARSSLGRNFIEVCKCAGWGDVGYINRWTMEITNNSTHHIIPLVVGRRVAQIIFFDTGDTVDDYSRSGKYQTVADIEEIKASWNPSSMLPRLYLDREITQHKEDSRVTSDNN
jgi:dCTP deaminase